MDMQKFCEDFEYYKHNPDLYIEDIMGIKLLPYQKLMLKMSKPYHILFCRHNGRDFFRKLQVLNSLALLDPDEKVAIYARYGIKEMSRDEAIEMIYKQLYK